MAKESVLENKKCTICGKQFETAKDNLFNVQHDGTEFAHTQCWVNRQNGVEGFVPNNKAAVPTKVT